MRWVQCLLVAWCLVQVAWSKKKGRAGKKDWRMARCKRMMSPLQEEIEEIQKTVTSISNPVHIHVHGVSSVDSSVDGDVFVNDEGSHDDDKSSEDHDLGHDHRHGPHRHHKHPKHHGHHKHGHHRGSEERRHGGRSRGGRGGDSREERRGSEDRDTSSNEVGSSAEDSSDEDDDDDDEGPNQSHIHIHLNVAVGGSSGRGSGGEVTSCPTEHGGYPKDKYIFACCKVIPNEALVDSDHNVRGNIYLKQKPTGPIELKIDVRGFGTRGRRGPQSHGFHVHEFADFSDGCNSFGGHFNPGGHAHGGPGAEHRHAGDWGNIESNNKGVIVRGFNTTGYLYGRESIIGRGIVIHEAEDDHGMAGTHSSRTTGSAGARVGCCCVSHCKGT